MSLQPNEYFVHAPLRTGVQPLNTVGIVTANSYHYNELLFDQIDEDYMLVKNMEDWAKATERDDRQRYDWDELEKLEWLKKNLERRFREVFVLKNGKELEHDYFEKMIFNYAGKTYLVRTGKNSKKWVRAKDVQERKTHGVRFAVLVQAMDSNDKTQIVFFAEDAKLVLDDCGDLVEGSERNLSIRYEGPLKFEKYFMTMHKGL